MHAYFFVEKYALSKFCWDYKGLKGILVFMTDGTKPKFYSVDENRQLMYPDLIDISAPAHSFSIRDDINVRLQIHTQFEKRAASVLSQYHMNKGKRNWEKLGTKTLKFHIFENQLASHQVIEEEVKSLKSDLEEWREAHANLEKDKANLLNEMRETVNNMAEEINILQETNSQLEDYIKCLERQNGFTYNGKDISEAKNKQRTLKTFMTKAETALWFSKAFGLELESIKVKESNTGKSHEVYAGGSTSSCNADEDEEMARIEQILYLQDKFCVSDEFYHELTMVENGIPRSYLVKQKRKDLNKLCHIFPTPDLKFEGAQISFQSLLSDQISAFMMENPTFDIKANKIKVKISGDGAKMTQNSNFVILSCALLQKEK